MKQLATIASILLIAATLTAVPVWLLWNWLMPTIFDLPTITLLQALGMSVLSSLLFKQTVTKS